MIDFTTVLLIVITMLTAVLIWSRRTYVYWQRRRVKFSQPTHLLGNLKEVLWQRNSFALQLRDFYFDTRFAEEPLIGIYLFHQPALLLRDLNLVRTVLVEDFVSFSNRFAKCDPHQDKLGAFNLYFVKNPEWREIRTKFAPAFSKGEIKRMFTLMAEVGSELEAYLHRLTDRFDKHTTIVQIKEICDLYNTDLISSIAFGLRTYSLRNKQTEIGVHARQIFTLKFRRAFDFCVIFFLPKFVPLLRPKLFTPEHADFLRRIVLQALEERERTGMLRNDLIEVLLTLKKEADLNADTTHFTHRKEYLASQVAFFEMAGIETCSTTMAFTLYELAKQPLIQARLRAEIRRTFGKSLEDISYEKVMAMQYMDMVVNETLRMYPSVPMLERECTPINKKRFYSFRPWAECMARRGMAVYVSNLAIHHDPKYWPQPEKFDPERFSPENRLLHTPMSFLPFGAGPHNCLGISLAQLQVKLGLIHFLHCHRVECCDQTADKVEFDRQFALLGHKGGIYLTVKRCS